MPPAAPVIPPPRLPYQPGLDNLRAVAALSVCLFHFASGQLPERERVAFTADLFAHGFLGVMLFFVLSGYIIPYSLRRQGYQLRQFGTYLWRRALRINPPAYVALLLTLLSWLIAAHLGQHGPRYLAGLSVAQVAHNLLFTVPFTPYKWLVGVAWTLGIEWQFYLFMGVLFPLLFTRARPGWWLAGGYLLLSGWCWLVPPALTLLTYAPLFALGSVALLWQQGQLSRAGFAALLLLFGGLAYYQIERAVRGTGLESALTGLLAVTAILLVTRRVPGLAFVGKISYSLYLTHIVVGLTTEFLVSHRIAPDSDLHRTLTLLICLAATLAFATGFYYVVERPCIALAKRVRGR